MDIIMTIRFLADQSAVCVRFLAFEADGFSETAVQRPPILIPVIRHPLTDRLLLRQFIPNKIPNRRNVWMKFSFRRRLLFLLQEIYS